ncbi:MAG TPA: LCP family protein [Solirubrobacteraceae bacterium]|nr:LCP family protein [Solirubrobacteraceae bacterium]
MTSGEPPKYTKYRAKPSLLKGRKEPSPDAPKAPGRQAEPPDLHPDGPRPAPHLPYEPQRATKRRKPISKWRVARWVLGAIAAWLLLSLVVFLVSAQIQQGQVSDETETALAGGGLPVGSSTNVLVLGSDQRPEGTKEAGASTSGPSRSDSIMLMRVGGGANSRLSIARDTMVDIPGHGRQKINAAYAFGGAALAIRTVSAYTGIEVNHVIEVSFSEFPKLIDAMGGINYKGSCVVAKINGGYKNGGVTVRIPAGKKTHLDGKQALALSRVRKNSCNPAENDLSRARRQQRIIGAMRSRVLSPSGFVRLPFISWNVPRTFKTDMSGPTLMAVFGSLATGGTPETNVLGTISGEVPEDRKQRAVSKFLDG